VHKSKAESEAKWGPTGSIGCDPAGSDEQCRRVQILRQSQPEARLFGLMEQMPETNKPGHFFGRPLIQEGMSDGGFRDIFLLAYYVRLF
jgi:hypothetical protein